MTGDPEDQFLCLLQASKNKRGGMVWRSARERRVWLKDAKLALDCQQASWASYLVAALVDRSAVELLPMSTQEIQADIRTACFVCAILHVLEVGVVCREMAMWPAVYQGTHFVKLSEYNTHSSLQAQTICA